MSRKERIDRATLCLLEVYINYHTYLGKMDKNLAARIKNVPAIRSLTESSKNGRCVTLSSDVKRIEYNHRDRVYEVVYK